MKTIGLEEELEGEGEDDKGLTLVGHDQRALKLDKLLLDANKQPGEDHSLT